MPGLLMGALALTMGPVAGEAGARGPCVAAEKQGRASAPVQHFSCTYPAAVGQDHVLDLLAIPDNAFGIEAVAATFKVSGLRPNPRRQQIADVFSISFNTLRAQAQQLLFLVDVWLPPPYTAEIKALGLGKASFNRGEVRLHLTLSGNDETSCLRPDAVQTRARRLGWRRRASEMHVADGMDYPVEEYSKGRSQSVVTTNNGCVSQFDRTVTFHPA